jgi:hypothetical protein
MVPSLDMVPSDDDTVDIYYQYQAMTVLCNVDSYRDRAVSILAQRVTTTDRSGWHYMLARELMETDEAVSSSLSSALTAIFLSAPDVDQRLRAADLLLRIDPIPNEVVEGLSSLATNIAYVRERIRAVALLRGAGHMPPADVITNLVAVAAGTDEAELCIEAAEILSTDGLLSPNVVANLEAVAVGRDDFGLSVAAIELLSQVGSLSVDVSESLLVISNSAADWQLREKAAELLANAGLPSDELEDRLFGLLGDEDNDVRTAAVASLVSLAYRDESARSRIESAFETICTSFDFEARDKIRHRAGWDYCYDGLWSLATQSRVSQAQ